MASKQSSTLNVNVELLQSNIIRVSITTLSPRFKVPFETLRTDFGQHNSQHNNDATIDDFVQVSDDQTPFKLSHDAMDPFDDGKPPGKNIFLIEY